MAQTSVAEDEFPEGFVSDAARALRAIEDIQQAAVGLYDAALDADAQERMRRTLEPTRLVQANQAALRVVTLRVPVEGV